MDRKGANTFPFYNLPPALKISKKGIFLCFFPFQLDKIKVSGDSYLPRHFANKIAKCKPAFQNVPVLATVSQNWRLCWGRNKWGVP